MTVLEGSIGQEESPREKEERANLEQLSRESKLLTEAQTEAVVSNVLPPDDKVEAFPTQLSGLMLDREEQAKLALDRLQNLDTILRRFYTVEETVAISEAIRSGTVTHGLTAQEVLTAMCEFFVCNALRQTTPNISRLKDYFAQVEPTVPAKAYKKLERQMRKTLDSLEKALVKELVQAQRMTSPVDPEFELKQAITRLQNILADR